VAGGARVEKCYREKWLSMSAIGTLKKKMGMKSRLQEAIDRLL
jgi:hypothetical protein